MKLQHGRSLVLHRLITGHSHLRLDECSNFGIYEDDILARRFDVRNDGDARESLRSLPPERAHRKRVEDHPVSGKDVHSNLVLSHTSVPAVQYLSIGYTERLSEAGAVNSLDSRGASCVAAPTESFSGLHKTELIRRRGPWHNVDEVDRANLT